MLFFLYFDQVMTANNLLTNCICCVSSFDQVMTANNLSTNCIYHVRESFSEKVIPNGRIVFSLASIRLKDCSFRISNPPSNTIYGIDNLLNGNHGPSEHNKTVTNQHSYHLDIHYELHWLQNFVIWLISYPDYWKCCPTFQLFFPGLQCKNLSCLLPLFYLWDFL